MDYTEIRAGLNNAVPMNKTLGLEVVDMGPGTGVVRLPDDERLRNHVGSQHAGALFAAGEAASGAAMVGAFFANLAGVTPLAAKAEIAYRRIAKGVITATGRLSADPAAIIAQLDADGKAQFRADVDLTDADGAVVATMSVDWHLSKR